MVCLANFVALAGFFASVSATQADIGWAVEVATSEVTFNTDNVGGEERLFIDAPIIIHRLQARADTATLNVYTSPYLSQNETNSQAQSPGRALVYTTTTQPPLSSKEFVQSVSFNVSAAPWQDLFLIVDINDGQSILYTVQRTGAVITYNATLNQWTAWNTGTYAAKVNSAIIQRLKRFIPGGQDETAPEDSGERAGGYQRVDRVVPKDGSSSTTVPIVEQTTTIPAYEPSVTSPTIPGCSCDPVTVYRTVTVYPESSTPPPPDDKKKHETRDDRDILPAFVNARVTFVDREFKERPVRLLRVTAHADVYDGDSKIGTWQSIETLNENGEALFQFSISPGQRVVAHTLYTELRGDYYIVGTRNSSSDDFQVTRVQLDLSVNPWMVKAGETVSTTNSHGFDEYTKGLWVADTYHTLADFFSTRVATEPGEMEKVNVWYPSAQAGTFFSVGDKVPYINLPAIEAQNPAVMAHEYGHFAHYLARSKESFNGGGAHSFCFNAGVKNETSFSEGYATALGLMAIDNTHLTGGDYMVYTDRGIDGVYSRSMEDFSCLEKNMNNQEGRIGAALIDLVDRQLETFQPERDDLGLMGSGFDPQLLNWCFTPRLIFWRAVYDNPATMLEYWRQLQAILTGRSEDIAWAILQYNYADFPRDP
ncbi:hypothetical protein QQX98_012939 [Neonectria punicea]|uniref:Uncharacterized protein n=1 Tax=Neonectria punicea TaxID=979145 RepID=A0ABR1GHF7_9HYPO